MDASLAAHDSGGRAGDRAAADDAAVAMIAVSSDDALRPFLEALGPPSAPGMVRGGQRAPAGGLRVLPVDAWDVPVLVERGVVDAGVVAPHILAELRADVVQVLDLGLASSRLVLATPRWMEELPAPRPRVATTHPRTAGRYFARRGTQAEIVALRLAAGVMVELGAADAAVVALGEDREAPADDLVVRDDLVAGGVRLIVGRSARLVRAAQVGAVLDRVALALGRLGGEGEADAAS